MDKLVYYAGLEDNPEQKVISFHKTFLSEVQDLFVGKHVNLYQINKSSVGIYQAGYHLPYNEWFLDTFNLLKKNGFILTQGVQNKLDYYSQIVEKQKAVDKLLRDIQLKNYYEKKNQTTEDKTEYRYWCNKCDCETTLEYCKNECAIGRRIYCTPQKVKIIKKQNKEGK